MLKPVTEEEKAIFTLRVQADKAKEELLSEAFYSDYDGYLDIWAVIKTKKGKLVLEMETKRLSNSTQSLSHKDAVRYHVMPGKGVKKIK